MSVNGSMMRRNSKPREFGDDKWVCVCWLCTGSKRDRTRAQERRDARRDIAEQLAAT